MVRPMDFGGSWYPREAGACSARIETFWEGQPPAVTGRYGVAPHAGWIFSGALAARVYRALRQGGETPLVVVLGGHLGRNDPIVAMCEGEWETPFGAFTIHGGFLDRLKGFSHLTLESPSRYHPDNSTELQLPFAKYAFPRAELLPLRLPPGSLALEVGAALSEYLAHQAPDAVVVASTDLTHYGPNYRFEPMGRGAEAMAWAREVNDAAFIEAVRLVSGAGVLESSGKHHNACSAGAVAAVSELARLAGHRFHSLGYANSADVHTGDKVNFVGYLGGVFG